MLMFYLLKKLHLLWYRFGVYESVQKFGNLITIGKITGNTHVPKVAELLSESSAFYDAEMIAGLINAMLSHNTKRDRHRQSYSGASQICDESIEGCRGFTTIIINLLLIRD